MLSENGIEPLKRFLIDLPHQLEHSINKEIRTLIHKVLFLSITDDGRFLKWFFPIDAHQSNSLDDVVEQRFNWLLSTYYSDLSKQETRELRRDHTAIHSSLPCAQIFRKGEPIYKCLTCGYDDTCALCHNCFQPEHHEGHVVYVSICVRDNGGVCDCRDPEAWVQQFKCIHAEEDKQFSLLKTADIPGDFERSFCSVLETLLDFVIDVMSQSDLQLFKSRLLPRELSILSANCSLDPKKYGYPGETMGYDKPSEKFSLIAYNDQTHHMRDALQRIHLASKKVPEFASMVAHRIQGHGRAVILRSHDVSLLCERQNILNATGISSCIRNSRDEFREEMCLEILTWLESITRSDLFKANNTIKNIFCRTFCSPWQKGLIAQQSFHSDDYLCGHLDRRFGIPEGTIVNSLPMFWKEESKSWEEVRRLNNEFLIDSNNEKTGGHPGSRFQYLVYLDVRFWKAFRSPLHNMYATSLITNLKWKNVICWQYVDIYSCVSDMFLTLDGEPENNVMCTLSCQLFICPSNSTAILAHGNMLQLMGTIYSFLTQGEAVAKPVKSNKVLFLSLKNRRWGQIFFDTGYVLSRAQHSNFKMTQIFIEKACDIFCLFHGKPIIKRESESHIEYESSDYTAFFHAILVIFQFADSMSQSLRSFSDTNSKKSMFGYAIGLVTRYLIDLEIDKSQIPMENNNETDYGRLSGETEGLNEFRIDKGKVSFLHPLHSFISWLIEYANFHDKNEFLSLITMAAGPNKEWLRVVFDYPLRTVVLCSQIKVGFWVRNGFSVKNQLQLYRSTGLREQGFYRDVFLVQTFLVCEDRDIAVEWCLKRWLLNDVHWTNDSSAYDAGIFPYILEECLTHFIHILSEDLNLRGYSGEQIAHERIKLEIIHHLCFGPMSYSRLCSQIPDHVCSEKRFDMILDGLAIYKQPNSPKETGTYVLKEEYFGEINPFYHNYSTNKREDATKLLKDRIRDQSGLDASVAIIDPPVKNRENFGMFSSLGNFTGSLAFVKFLSRSLTFVMNESENKGEGIVEVLLHLIHMCMKEASEGIDSFASRLLEPIDATTNTSLGSLLYDALKEEHLKLHHSKIRAILMCLGRNGSDAAAKLEATITGFDGSCLDGSSKPNSTENEAERKRRLARKRQAKLMMKFKQQQSLFLENHDVGDDLEMDISDEDMDAPRLEGWDFPEARCILCQDSTTDSGPFGIIANLSKFSAFRDIPFENDYWFLEAFSGQPDLCPVEGQNDGMHYTQRWKAFMKEVGDGNVIGPGFPKLHHSFSKPIALTCGHGMHFNCYVQYVASNRSRSNHITRNMPDSVEHREFLCPLCKSINNLFIPILWTTNTRSFRMVPLDWVPQKDSPFDAFSEDVLRGLFDESCRLVADHSRENCLLSGPSRGIIGSRSRNQNLAGSQQFRSLLTNMFQALSLLTFPRVFKSDATSILLNTIKATEISLRGQSSPSGLLFYQIPSTNLVILRALNEFRLTNFAMNTSERVSGPMEVLNSHMEQFGRFLCLSKEKFNLSIVTRDFIDIYVGSIGYGFSGLEEWEVLRMCFFGHIIQIYYRLAAEFITRGLAFREKFDLNDVPLSQHVPVITQTPFRMLVKAMNQGKWVLWCDISDYDAALSNMVVKCATPFLRQAMVYRYVTCPRMDDAYFDSSCSLEADRICHALHIPTILDILGRLDGSDNSEDVNNGIYSEKARFDSFVSYVQNRSLRENLELAQPLEYPNQVRLIDLPQRLDHFFTDYFYLPRFGYPHKSIDSPAVCLFCAEIMDAQKHAVGTSYGQCTAHIMKECPNVVGMFLLPKDRAVLLLHGNGGSFHESPYLDAHSEVPNENKKNKAIYLLKEKYDDLTRHLWLQQHSLNYIVRKLDSVVDAGGWETL